MCSGMANALLVVTSALTRFVSCTGEVSTTNLKQQIRHARLSAKRFPLVKEVLEYIREPLKEGCGVLLEMIRNQVLTIVRKQGILVKDFRASSGWTTCFMRQNELSLRWQTSSCQWLQSTYEVINFHCFVTRICEEKGFLLLRIRNADQTPLNVNMP